MRICFVGLGMMGHRMCGHLVAAGHDVTVFDLDRNAAASVLAAGATWADSAAAAANGAEIAFTSLPGPPEVTAVANATDGLGAGLAVGVPWFDLSTNAPTTVRQLHAELGERGIPFLDAPVSGGPAGASSKRLALWVGGDEAIFDRFKAVLADFGDRIHYAGPIGAGSVTKLVHNCAGYVIQTALAEVMTLGVKAGVEPLDLWRAIREGANGRRRTFDGLVDQFLPGEFDPANFALKLAHKDVSLATALGREFDVPMRLANLTLEEMTEAMNRGWQSRDSRSPMLLQEERAGVEIAVSRDAIQAVLDSSG